MAQAPGPLEPELLAWRPVPLAGALAALQPLRPEWVTQIAQGRRVATLPRQYHYQGIAGAVGEDVQHQAFDRLPQKQAQQKPIPQAGLLVEVSQLTAY